MTVKNPYTEAYTTIVEWSRLIPDEDLSTPGMRYYAAEQLVDDYSLKVSKLGQKEWKALFHAICNYLETVKTK